MHRISRITLAMSVAAAFTIPTVAGSATAAQPRTPGYLVLCTGGHLDGDCIAYPGAPCAVTDKSFHSADNHTARPEWLFSGHHCAGNRQLVSAGDAVYDFPIGG